MEKCQHLAKSARKKCSRCDTVTNKIWQKFCKICKDDDQFVYTCLECNDITGRSCQHFTTALKKRCSNCSESCCLDDKFCLDCGTMTNFKVFCSDCESVENERRNGFVDTETASLVALEALGAFGLSLPFEKILFLKLLNCKDWIDQTMSSVLDGSIPLVTSEQRDQLWRKLQYESHLARKSRSATDQQLMLLGSDVAEKLTGLKDAVRQIQAETAPLGTSGSDNHHYSRSNTSRASTSPGGRHSNRAKQHTRDTPIRRTPITEDNEATAVEYFKIHDRVTRYAKAEHGFKLDIRNIEKVSNQVLDRRLNEVRRQLFNKSGSRELLIHGTNSEAAEQIIQEGFKVGTGGMFGAGIYFATDSTKSAQYCTESGVKSLLICEVLLGKTFVCEASMSELNLETVQALGYDSVFAKRNTKGTGGVANDEYIVYRAEQATPRYLVKFEISSVKENKSDCSIL